MYKISNKIINFARNVMEIMKSIIDSGTNSCRVKNLKKHLPVRLAFVAASHNNFDATQSEEKISHFIYMDVIKVFTKNEKELETLIQTIRIYSQDRGMEYGIEKSTMLKMRNRKRESTEKIELPNQKSIRTL